MLQNDDEKRQQLNNALDICYEYFAGQMHKLWKKGKNMSKVLTCPPVPKHTKLIIEISFRGLLCLIIQPMDQGVIYPFKKSYMNIYYGKMMDHVMGQPDN